MPRSEEFDEIIDRIESLRERVIGHWGRFELKEALGKIKHAQKLDLHPDFDIPPAFRADLAEMGALDDTDYRGAVIVFRIPSAKAKVLIDPEPDATHRYRVAMDEDPYETDADPLGFDLINRDEGTVLETNDEAEVFDMLARRQSLNPG